MLDSVIGIRIDSKFKEKLQAELTPVSLSDLTRALLSEWLNNEEKDVNWTFEFIKKWDDQTLLD